MEINSTVDTFLADLIAAWPTLFKTREDALLRVASQEWNHMTGEPVDDRGESEQDLSRTFEEILTEMAGKNHRSNLMDEFDRRHALIRLRENNDALFTRNNAVLIASLKGDFKSPPRLSTFDVNRFPAKMTPAWKAAMIELADRILQYRDAQIDTHCESPISRDQYRQGLKDAQVAAKEILARFAPERASKVEQQARDQEIQKLRYAAEKFGFTLAPVAK